MKTTNYANTLRLKIMKNINKYDYLLKVFTVDALPRWFEFMISFTTRAWKENLSLALLQRVKKEEIESLN